MEEKPIYITITSCGDLRQVHDKLISNCDTYINHRTLVR